MPCFKAIRGRIDIAARQVGVEQHQTEANAPRHPPPVNLGSQALSRSYILHRSNAGATENKRLNTLLFVTSP
jgi:hypothetical protein